MRREYVIQKYGPGYCRNGHARADHGQTTDGSCRKCRSENGKRRYIKGRGKEVIRKRAAQAIIDDPSILERDIAAMRARVAARNAA